MAKIRNIKSDGSGLKWSQVSDGAILGNSADVDKVKAMFASKRQKTRADQRLFWKMRDDNLLCFRINDGKGTSGQYQVMVRNSTRNDKGKTRELKQNVSS